MKQRIVVRMLVGFFVIAVLFVAYQWFANWSKDPDIGSSDTSDMVAAVEYLPNGSRIVLLDANAKKTDVPDYKDGSHDVDPVWRPDGQRVFFSSDRAGQSNNVFRWNVAKNTVEQRLYGSRSASSPWFGPAGWRNLENSALITIGGNVYDFDQSQKRTRQVLPPMQFEGSAGNGEGDLASSAYNRIGQSFKAAKWGKDRKVIYSVMHRDDDEVFLVTAMEQIGKATPGPIGPIIAGKSIEFDVSVNGVAVISVQGFEYPSPNDVPKSNVKNGRAYKPYRNGLFTISLDDAGQLQIAALFTDRPDLGVSPEMLTDALRQQTGLPATVNGVYVADVAPGSAASVIGMRVGDVVTQVNGKPVADQQGLFAAFSGVLIGESAEVTYYSAKDKASKTADYVFGPEASVSLRDPCVSPDGKYVAVTRGMVKGYNFTSEGLMIVPLNPSDPAGPHMVVQGVILGPDWSPEGDKLTYAKIGPAGDSQIWVIGADGSGERNISGPGDFGNPRYSPMKRPAS